MRRQRRRDTGPELALRRLLHATGLRYRVNFPVPNLPRRTIDIALTRPKLAVFVDGCFWHSCPVHGTLPRSNNDWWRAKLEANRRRDDGTDLHLQELGWTVVRIWEHEYPEDAADTVRAALDRLRA